MAQEIEVRVPDLGDSGPVDVIEILVSPGSRVEEEDGLLVLSSDKASMDLPAPAAGTVQEIHIEAGSKVSVGDLVMTLEAAEAEGDDDAHPEKAESDEPPAAASEAQADDEPTAEAPAPQASRVETEGADEHHALVVIGSGPGGYAAAFRAADLGMEVALIERYPNLGGVCLNVGCIPSKALLHAAKVIDEAQSFAEHGIRFGEPEIDLDGLRSWKDDVVGKLTGGIAGMAKQRKVTVIEGEARFASPHRLEVTSGDGTRTISFDQAIIAAGSRVTELPFLPHDDPRVMDSTDALALEDVPKKLLVIGGGIIGLEMATVYEALGSKVTVVELLDGLIPEADRDLVRPLEKRIRERYEAIYLGTKLTRLVPGNKGLTAHFEGEKAPKKARFDRALVAVGRRPNGDLIGAEAAGLTVDPRGFIQADRQQRTAQPHIFAIGDIAGQPMLAHKATHEGKVAAEVAAGQKSSFDARVIPSVAYTDPEVAWVGLTEKAAKRDGIPFERGAFPWAASGRALALGRKEGMTKLLFDPETHRVIGAGAVGPNAGDLISEAALAIEMGAEAADIGLTIHPHPTLSETVAFAAEVFEGTITDLYLPKRRRR